MTEKKTVKDTEVTTYVAFDGMEFPSKEMCEHYERCLGNYLYTNLERNGVIKIIWNKEMESRFTTLVGLGEKRTDEESCEYARLRNVRELNCSFASMVRDYCDSTCIAELNVKEQKDLDMLLALFKCCELNVNAEVPKDKFEWCLRYQEFTKLKIGKKYILYSEYGNEWSQIYDLDELIEDYIKTCNGLKAVM